MDFPLRCNHTIMPPPTVPKYLIVVAGPTAVGKTALCIQLAQHLRTEIISADARQCYQGMTIGTAQPTPAAMQGVPHHLVNFLSVQAPYNAGMFAQDVLKILENLLEKYDHVLMTGGSGLYIQAVCQGLDAMPPVAPTIRANLNKRLQTVGLPALLAVLASHDPTYYQVVDRTNPQRVIRQEAVALYPYRHYNALQTVGYREIFGYLAGHYSQAEAIRLLKINTRRYAKRQLTWFRRDPAMHWFHPDDGPAILDHIQKMTTTL